MRYKLIVYGKKLYKETVIPDDVETIMIGPYKELSLIHI